MNQPFLWLAITFFCLFLCTFLPIWIKDPAKRRFVSWYILVPISLVLVAYAYPAGIEIFKSLAVQGPY